MVGAEGRGAVDSGPSALSASRGGSVAFGSAPFLAFRECEIPLMMGTGRLRCGVQAVGSREHGERMTAAG